MNKKQVRALLIMITLMLSIYLSSVPTALAIVVPRDETLWACGYWGELTTFNPIRSPEGSQGWDMTIMYEGLFTTDVASGQLVKWLGESITWVSPTIIEVTLRPGLYWVKISPANWARWLADDPTYDPEYYRPITTEDVKYTYLLYGAFDESAPAELAWYMDGFRARVGPMSNFEIVSDRTFRVHIKPEYANSDVVWRTIIGDTYVIVPKDIWQQIDPHPVDGGYLEFANDWTDPAYPYPRVASGMYLSWYISDLKDTSIIKKNDKWWGVSVLDRQPLPKYMGYLWGFSNVVIKGWISDGKIDWDGDYIDAIWDKTLYPYAKTYLANPPYFVDAAANPIIPNNLKWPISEPWLHWAIADVLNYKAISDIASGYATDGSKYSMYGTQIQYPNAFLLPKDDFIANQYLINYPNKDNYLIGNVFKGTDAALALIQANCVDSTGGTWTKGEDAYTKGTTEALTAWAQNLYNYYGDIDLVVGTVKKLASQWLGPPTTFDTADQLPGVDGINVKLGVSDTGTWGIIDIEEWTDVVAKDGVVASTVTSALGIPLTSVATGMTWDSYIAAMDANTFDFADYAMLSGLNTNLYSRYKQLFWGPYSGAWAHFGSYANPTLDTLVESLDTAPDKQTVANQIFDIVGRDLPIIPMSGMPEWYIYQDLYWQRWPNENHAYLPPSCYGGTHDLYIMLSLGQLVPHSGMTPVPTDLDNNRKVNIKDISLAARAFASYPGHPRWEFVADVMPVPAYGDGVVNILDIGRIAIDFGISY